MSGRAWSVCPWCDTAAAPREVQIECKYWHKADNDLICATCGHDHLLETERGETCSGFVAPFGVAEPCDCVTHVTTRSPCEHYVSTKGAAGGLLLP